VFDDLALRIDRPMRVLTLLVTVISISGFRARAQLPLPTVAIHDSELTRALESLPAVPPTPSGAGTTGKQWWLTDWHYFVMPESMKEALKSDGTSFTVVGDSNIASAVLLTNGAPRFPIVISLAAEAMRDDEISVLTNYVSAGGFLFVGSSSFTRNTNGTTRGDFAIADAMGLHMSIAGLTNWAFNNTVTRLISHRLTAHLPAGALTWRMPSSSEEIPWGISPNHPFLAPHDIWRVTSADATVLAQGDGSPFLTIKRYGKGYFIYCAAFQPLMGHSGFAPSTYAYVIFRRAIEWAFESFNMPVPKISSWPYQYDAALMVRHDLENFTNEVAAIESSAQFEFTNHALGDYYFCTGTLRDDAWPTFDTNSIVAGLRRAVTNWGATIGPHNGGLKNPNNNALLRGDYDYWHWGTDEALATNPPGYASGKAYATISLSNSFREVESWLSGVTNGLRSWVQCYFNGTREDSYDLQAQVGVNISGDQKITPFPHWTLSTVTPNKRYSFLTEPVSDWFVGGLVAQSLEPWHSPGIQTTNTLHSAIDFYYNLGALINFYSHTLSTGFGPAGSLQTEYVVYSVNTNLHPRLWAANGALIYKWWQQRTNVQVTASYSTNASGQSLATLTIKGAANTNCAVELVTPGSGLINNLQVLTNGVLAGDSLYRVLGQTIRLRTGTTVTNAQFKYFLGPRAADDNYAAVAGTPLTVDAPGVLANDGLGAIAGVTIGLVTNPLHGSLLLNTNGGFVYSPTNGFTGDDTFAYNLTDAQGDTSTAQVTISVSSGDVLLADDFSRAADPGSLTPWIANSGDWTVSGGAISGTNNPLLYANAYVTNVWGDYRVEARVRFAPGAFGGGIGGRVNAVNGAHYAAWIYPEGSPGGSGVLKLVKFQDWTVFAYNGALGAAMAEASLAAVGTNFHTVKMAFRGNRIAVYFDGTQMISMADTDAQPYNSGGVSLDFWTASNSYLFTADDVLVKPLVTSDSHSLSEDTPLTVAAEGVLANDTGVYDTNLTATLLAGPSYGFLDFSTNGGFTYTPFTNYAGPDTFVYQASDGGTNLGAAIVSLFVESINDPPVLPTQLDRTMTELSDLVVTNTASDPDTSADALNYFLVNPPDGVSISSNGIIEWIPSELQGPGTNVITTVVIDSGVPPLSATNRFTVVVTEVNSSPVLRPQTNQTIAESAPLVVTNTATDSDVPANTLAYSFLAPPLGAVIDTNGVITWTPTEAQGPGNYLITTIVTDDGIPPLSATNSFMVAVSEVNSAPVLLPQNNQTIPEGVTLVITNAATDTDLPANILSYTLLSPPAGAEIDGAGVITWTPSGAQGPSTNVITTMVVDDGVPPLSATNSFVVVVREVNSAPILLSQPDFTVAEQTLLTVTNTASDFDLPANILTYSLVNPPEGALIDTNGIITWLPSETQGPSTNVFTTIATDDGVPPLSATNSFIVTVLEVNSAPRLSQLADQTIAELSILTITNAAVDSDIPANTLTYTLQSPPTGMQIDPDGVITWKPDESQGPGTNIITTVVTDDGVLPLSATNTFTVVVLEVNTAPMLPEQLDRTIGFKTTLVVTNTATDTDLPANIISYFLQSAPSGAQIDTNGIITWTPAASQAAGTNLIITIAMDDGIPPLSATNNFTVFVTPPPDPPRIISITVSNGLANMTWTSVPGLTYNLEYSADIEAPNWISSPEQVTADSITASATNHVDTAEQRYFRVVLWP
jgi:hypothetical protein